MASPASTAPLPSPWLTLGNITLLRYLYQFKPPPGVSMSEQAIRSYRHFLIGRQLFYCNIVLNVLRIGYLNYHLATGGRLVDQQPYAPLFTVLTETFHFYTGRTLLILAATIAIMAISGDYMICFKMDHRLLKITYQMMIENGEQLLEINRRQLGERPQFSWRKPCHFLQQWSQLIQSIWKSSNLQFRTSQLTEFPNVSVQLRACAFVYSTAIAWISWAFGFLFVLIFMAFEIAFLVMTFNHLPFATYLLLFFDTTFIIYCCINSFRVALLTIHISLLAFFACKRHIHQLNLELSQAFQQSQLIMFRYRYLHYFYREYLYLKAIVEHTNVHLVSPLVAVVFLSILVLSITLLSNLLFKSLLPGEKLFMAFTFAVLNLLPAFGCLALVSLSQSFYISERMLFRIQLMLSNGQGRLRLYKRATLLTAKMQLMSFYEMICTKNRFCFTVGPFGRISKRTIYEFCYAYSAMVMYVSGMIRDAHLKQKQI